MQTIPAVAGNKALVINAEFIKLTIYNDVTDPSDVSIYTFSSSYKQETIDGQVYTALGGLLAVGIQQRDIRVTSADTSITLSGIDGNNIYVVLANKIKGSKIEITRGFYDSNYNLTSYAHRFTGIVTSYNISEDRFDNNDNFAVTLSASSFLSVLENRISGRKTNKQSWQVYSPTDTSMNNVWSISGRTFDFGAPVTAKTNNPSGSSMEAEVTSQSSAGTF